MKHLLISITIVCALILSGCGGNNTPAAHDGHDHSAHAHEGHDHDHSAHNHDHSSHNHEGDDHSSHSHEGHNHETLTDSHTDFSDEIVFTKEQAAKTDFALYKVEPIDFTEVIRTSGQILSAPGDEASVVAPVCGIISLGTSRMADGVSVSKGKNLFYISSKNIAEGDYIARISSEYTTTKAAYERAQRLVNDQLVSQTEFEQARLAYETARNAYEALAKNSTEKGSGIGAPISGYITSIAIREGDYVETGQILASVSQNRCLTLRADVSEKYFNIVRGVTSANFKTSYDNRVYSLKDLNGRLLSTGKNSGAGSYYIPVTFEFDNRGEILPGSFAEIYLLGKPQTNVLAIPITSLTEEMGYYYVYVQLDDEGYRKQEVEVGASDGVNICILKGLTGGENIVSRGAYQVKMAAASGAAIPHGHTH